MLGLTLLQEMIVVTDIKMFSVISSVCAQDSYLLLMQSMLSNLFGGARIKFLKYFNNYENV